MSTIEYPAKSYEKCTRQQLLTTIYALIDQRDRALAEVERRKQPCRPFRDRGICIMCHDAYGRHCRCQVLSDDPPTTPEPAA